MNFGNPTCPETRLKWFVFNDLASFGSDETLNPETNALSMLSYGRIVDSKGLIESACLSELPFVTVFVTAAIFIQAFPAFRDRAIENTNSN